MLVVFPVGFDEKFILRALMRKREEIDGLGRGDKLIAVLPKGYREEQRTVNALKAIESIVGPIVGEENIIHLEVPSNGDEMVVTIKRSVEDNMTRDRVVLAVLSGGMRPLVVGTLLALMSLKSTRVIVESDFENLSGHISLELGSFLAPYSRRWAMILCGLMKGKSVRAIAEELGVSPATISNELKKMADYYLVRSERLDGRAPRYQITRAGKTYIKLMGVSCNEAQTPAPL